MTLVDVLCGRAARQPNQLAYQYLEDERAPVGESRVEALSYLALHRRATALARRLASVSGAEEKEGEPARLLLACPPGLDFVIAFFACLYAGKVAVPVPPPGRHRQLARWQQLLNDAAPAAVLTSRRLQSEVAARLAEVGGRQPVLCVDEASDAAEVETPPAGARPAGSALALLQYTSGSTSAPRGVRITHENLMHNLGLIAEAFGHDAASRGVIWLPPYHDMGLIGGILQPLYAGFPVTLMSPVSFLRQPGRWLEAIAHFRATTSGGPNFAYDHGVTRVPESLRRELDLSCWQVAFTGAETVRAATLQRFAAAYAPCGFAARAFLPCYGLAEATLLVSGGTREPAPRVCRLSRSALAEGRVQAANEDAEAGVAEIVSCGRVAPAFELVLVEPASGTPLPPDRIGEIRLRGASVGQGYWRQAEETARVFGAGGDDFLRTGDLGFLHAGELFLTGRAKELIVVRGRNYFPADLEACVEASHAALAANATAAFAVDDGTIERVIVLHEPGRAGLRGVEEAAVFAAIRAAISREFELEVHAILLLAPGGLPRTASGKIQRSACRLAYVEGGLNALAQWIASAAADAPPAAALPELHPLTQARCEAWLLAWLAARLNLPVHDLDVARPFAEFGLDSVAAVELAQALDAALAPREPFDPTLAWAFPTVRDLARHLAQPPASVAAAAPAQEEEVAETTDAAALLAAELALARRRAG